MVRRDRQRVSDVLLWSLHAPEHTHAHKPRIHMVWVGWIRRLIQASPFQSLGFHSRNRKEE